MSVLEITTMLFFSVQQIFAPQHLLKETALGRTSGHAQYFDVQVSNSLAQKSSFLHANDALLRPIAVVAVALSKIYFQALRGPCAFSLSS